MNKENLILKLYSISVTGILLFTVLVGFKSTDSDQSFREITVERINVVEPDGQIKMVISNKARQHPGMLNGEVFQERERPPGILFFNEEQDEVGGLSYYGNKEEGGNQVYLSFDQYKNDQVMHLAHYSNSIGDNKYGLQLWDRDKELTHFDKMRIFDSLDIEGYSYRQKLEYLKVENGGEPIFAPRMFVGRNYNRETGVFLQDKNGVDRLRLYIDLDNSPRLEVLSEEGTVIKDIIEN